MALYGAIMKTHRSGLLCRCTHINDTVLGRTKGSQNVFMTCKGPAGQQSNNIAGANYTAAWPNNRPALSLLLSLLSKISLDLSFWWRSCKHLILAHIAGWYIIPDSVRLCSPSFLARCTCESQVHLWSLAFISHAKVLAHRLKWNN